MLTINHYKPLWPLEHHQLASGAPSVDPLEHRPEGAAAPDLGAVGGAMGFEAMDGGENQRNMVIL